MIVYFLFYFSIKSFLMRFSCKVFSFRQKTFNFVKIFLNLMVFIIIQLTQQMGGKKKKQIKEPEVSIPVGDAKIGKSLFDQLCSACHSMEGDGKGASAPPLGGIMGRKAGETAFGYSKAMKGSGIVWSPAHIFMYIANPGKYIPGNKMSFSGIASDQERGHLIAYLSQ